MAKFIPADKIKKLREAAASGDEKAKKILRAQLDGSDFGADLDEYFKPAPVKEEQPAFVKGKVPHTDAVPGKGTTGLQKYLEDNGITEQDEDYDVAVEEYYAEFPDERPDAEPAVEAQEEIDLTKDIAVGVIDLIKKCDETSVLLMQNDELDDTIRKGAMTTIQEIKQSLLDNADKIRKIKNSLCKKEEKDLE